MSSPQNHRDKRGGAGRGGIKNVVNDVYQEDREELFKIFWSCLQRQIPGREGELQYLESDSGIMWMHLLGPFPERAGRTQAVLRFGQRYLTAEAEGAAA